MKIITFNWIECYIVSNHVHMACGYVVKLMYLEEFSNDPQSVDLLNLN